MSRWLQETGGSRGASYDQAFRDLAASGVDVHGEAAYVAALVPPGSRVLDAGCGTGRVTAALLERLPRGRVIAVDGAPSMIEEARRRLPAGRVEFMVADLATLELSQPVDHVLSTATFHWIADHDADVGRWAMRLELARIEVESLRRWQFAR